MEIAVFKITGAQYGLLMNNPAHYMGKLKAKALKGQAEADTKVYRNENGFLRFPAMAWRWAMISAASGRKFGKMTVFPIEDWVQILDAKTWKPRKDYEVVTWFAGCRRRSLPLVTNWACRLEIALDDEQCTPQQVLELLKLAGEKSGIGAFSPLRSAGPYGRFTAELEGVRQVSA